MTVRQEGMHVVEKPYCRVLEQCRGRLTGMLRLLELQKENETGKRSLDIPK